VFLDRRVKLDNLGSYQNAGLVDLGNNDKRHHRQQGLITPAQFPIFRELPCPLGNFAFTISDRLLGQNLALGYHIRSPGCSKQAQGIIEIGRSGIYANLLSKVLRILRFSSRVTRRERSTGYG